MGVKSHPISKLIKAKTKAEGFVRGKSNRSNRGFHLNLILFFYSVAYNSSESNKSGMGAQRLNRSKEIQYIPERKQYFMLGKISSQFLCASFYSFLSRTMVQEQARAQVE